MAYRSVAAQNAQGRWSPAALYACAGCIVILASFFEHLLHKAAASGTITPHSSEVRLFILLGMFSFAIVLGAAGLARHACVNSSSSSDRAAGNGPWLVFAALVVVHLSLMIVVLHAVKEPFIDVFSFQRDACENLLKGVDPFGATQADIYDAHDSALNYGPGMVVGGRVLVGFQYPPLTLLWVLPGYVLGDVRFSYILAVALAAWFLFALCPDNRGLAIVSVLLFSPVTFVIETCSFTEPLVYVTLCATIYAAVKKRWWMPIALGLFLASKQYNFLALPLIAYFVRPFQWKAYFKLTGLALATATATVLPFAIWNLSALWHDTVLFHLRQPYRLDSLSFAVPFPWIMKVGPVLALAFLIWALRARLRSAASFPAVFGITLLLLVVTSKQAFVNYYFLAGQTFFLAIVALIGAQNDDDAHPTQARSTQ
jgi:hypothetical protein